MRVFDFVVAEIRLSEMWALLQNNDATTTTASFFATTPPAAPPPITRKSTGSLGRSARPSVGRRVVKAERLLVGHPRFEADLLPTHADPVAVIAGVTQKAEDCQGAQQVEKLGLLYRAH